MRGAFLIPVLLLSVFMAGDALSDDGLDAAIGGKLFKRAWVPAPSSTPLNDGLGPLFNARACISCHANLDRMPIRLGPDNVVKSDARVLRLSDAQGRPDPVYGVQLQTAAVPGHIPEGRLVSSGGVIAVDNLSHGPFAKGTRQGVRDAPSLRGIGALERVPDDVIIDMARRQGEYGISGRPNLLSDGRIGRFGWKASAATVAEQTAAAFSLDLGMSTSFHPDPAGDCTPLQKACQLGPHGGDATHFEIGGEIVSAITAYLVSVDPPEINVDTEGEELFSTTGCAACHQPELTMADGSTAYAFTDLLLHEMGEGLDGGASESGVAPTEWRTAPLWGLSRTIAAGAGLLHDGRATTVEDAIGWHGGEASGARERFTALSAADKRRLLDYVSSR